MCSGHNDKYELSLTEGHGEFNYIGEESELDKNIAELLLQYVPNIVYDEYPNINKLILCNDMFESRLNYIRNFPEISAEDLRKYCYYHNIPKLDSICNKKFSDFSYFIMFCGFLNKIN